MTDCTYTHKRGDSFDLLVTIPARFADGYFADYTVASQLRTADGTLIADLACTWVDAATTRALRLEVLETQAWPVGAAQFDVEFTRTADGFKVSSTTAQILIVADVTRPAP